MGDEAVGIRAAGEGVAVGLKRDEVLAVNAAVLALTGFFSHCKRHV
jgi:hypothetical protein